VNANGSAAIWTLDSANNQTSKKIYGSYSGWVPVSYNQNSDGTRTLLWANANGSAAIWTLDSANNQTSNKNYGPYSGWIPFNHNPNP